MNILDRLTYKINKINNPQEKQMYQDIYDNLSAVIDYITKTTQTSKSHLIDRIQFDIDFLWDECRSLIFYTTLDNYEKRYLLRFDLWHSHYEIQYLCF